MDARTCATGSHSDRIPESVQGSPRRPRVGDGVPGATLWGCVQFVRSLLGHPMAGIGTFDEIAAVLPHPLIPSEFDGPGTAHRACRNGLEIDAARRG